MLMAVFTTFAASRKQPLCDVVERVHGAFVAAGFGEPVIRFSIADPPNSPELSAITTFMGTKRVSSIERVLKRWPELAPFARLAGSAARGSRAVFQSPSHVTGLRCISRPPDFRTGRSFRPRPTGGALACWRARASMSSPVIRRQPASA
jgi:hypothetical protein